MIRKQILYILLAVVVVIAIVVIFSAPAVWVINTIADRYGKREGLFAFAIFVIAVSIFIRKPKKK